MRPTVRARLKLLAASAEAGAASAPSPSPPKTPRCWRCHWHRRWTPKGLPSGAGASVRLLNARRRGRRRCDRGGDRRLGALELGGEGGVVVGRRGGRRTRGRSNLAPFDLRRVPRRSPRPPRPPGTPSTLRPARSSARTAARCTAMVGPKAGSVGWDSCPGSPGEGGSPRRLGALALEHERVPFGRFARCEHRLPLRLRASPPGRGRPCTSGRCWSCAGGRAGRLGPGPRPRSRRPPPPPAAPRVCPSPTPPCPCPSCPGLGIRPSLGSQGGEERARSRRCAWRATARRGHHPRLRVRPSLPARRSPIGLCEGPTALAAQSHREGTAQEEEWRKQVRLDGDQRAHNKGENISESGARRFGSGARACRAG